jgi:hypothetical protein
VPTIQPHQAATPQSVTSVPEARSEEQARRLKRYLATMALRTVCFVLLVVIDHPIRWVFAFGAVFLPFFAVVAANAVAPRIRGRVMPVLPTTDDTHLITRGPDSPTDR